MDASCRRICSFGSSSSWGIDNELAIDVLDFCVWTGGTSQASNEAVSRETTSN
jgi:hypothetical protein